MNELKCPKCGNVFKVDEADYGYIVGIFSKYLTNCLSL